jgi:hypothetical protein
MTPASPDTPNTGKTNAATSYVVLRLNDQTAEWAEPGDRVEAASAHDAIRKHAARTAAPMPASSSVYVAVPVRSWKPVTVRAEQTTVLKLETPT